MSQSSLNRAAAIAELFQQITRLSAPPLVLPTGPADMKKDNGVQLARSAADNAATIANACAQLGMDKGANDPQLAQDLWTATLAQMELVQTNLGYKYRYPFQSQSRLPQSPPAGA